MTIKRESHRGQPAAIGQRYYTWVLNKEVNTQIKVVLTLSKKAKRKIIALRPAWDAELIPVIAVPENHPDYFPGAVMTPNCRFCGQVHFFQGRVEGDDIGQRPLPCNHADILPEWQGWPRTAAILCTEVAE